MNEITIGDKIYISAKRAAEITGYARDYVGQLCREGHVDAKMVGRSWYVFEPSIRMHRFGEEAVPVPAPAAPATVTEPVPAAVEGSTAPITTVEGDGTWKNPTYIAEKPELLPELEAPKLEELLPPAEETLTDMQTAWREWFEQRQTQLQTPEIESPEVIDERNEAYQQEIPEAPAVHLPEEAEITNEEVSIPMHRIQEHTEREAPAALEAPEEDQIPIRTIAPAPVHTPVSAPTLAYVPTPRPEPIYTPAHVPANYHNESVPMEHGRIISERVIPAKKKGIPAKPVRSQRSQGSNAPVIAALVAISLISIAVAAIGTGYAERYVKTLPTKNNPVINFLVGTREFKR